MNKATSTNSNLDKVADFKEANDVVSLFEGIVSGVGSLIPALGVSAGSLTAAILPHIPNLADHKALVCGLLAAVVYPAFRKKRKTEEAEDQQAHAAILAAIEELSKNIGETGRDASEDDIVRLYEQVETLYGFKASKADVRAEFDKVWKAIESNNATYNEIKELLLNLAAREPGTGETGSAKEFVGLLTSGLADIRRDIAAVRADVRAGNAPKIHTPAPAPDKNAFRYADQLIPLVGREREKRVLTKFLEDSSAAAWILAIGGAGSGKSRIGLWAVEKAQELGYDAGFLVTGVDFSAWHEWVILQDTFIVVDYAQRRKGDLGASIAALKERRNGFRVRVLVLERDPAGTWYSQLEAQKDDRFDPDKDPAREFRWLDLRTMERPGVIEVFQALNDARGESQDPEALADGFLQAEPNGRPLFAAFYHDAVCSGTDVTQWKPVDLANWVLEHEANERWRPAGLDHAHANLLTVACAVTRAQLEEVSNEACLQPHMPAEWNGDLCHVVSSLGGGFDESGVAVPALQPDTLAELYILKRLEEKSLTFGTAVGQHLSTKKVLECLWAVPAYQDALVDVVQRSVRNFPGHASLATLESVPESVPKEVRDRLSAQVLAARSSAGGTVDMETVRRVSGDAALFLTQVLFARHFDNETTEEGKAALAELRALAQAHPGEAGVRLTLAEALYNATVDRETTEEGKAALAELRALAQAHPGEAEVRLTLAKALTNAALRLEKDEERQAALAELRALAQAHPGEAEARLELAKALYNATVERETTEEGKAALAELRALAQAHPGEAEVRLTLAEALYNATVERETTEEGKAALAELRALAQAHPGEAEVRLTLAEALTNAALRLEKDEERQAALAELRALAHAHPGEAGVRLELAKALCIQGADRWNGGDRASATPFFVEAKDLAQGHEDDPEWAKVFDLLGMVFRR